MLESAIFMTEALLVILNMDNYRVHLGKHPKDNDVHFTIVLELNKIWC